MRYFIVEGTPDGEYNASNKARQDVENILLKQNIQKFFVPTKNGIQKNKLMKWKQFLVYKKNLKVWNESLSVLKKGDIVYIQYPILNITLNLKKIVKKYKKQGIVFVSIVHDMDSLRFNTDEFGKMHYKRLCDDDKYLLNEMNYIICHNESMKKVLIDFGNDENKIIELKLFDYLIDLKPSKIIRNRNDAVIIAGNLSPFKAKYISQIKELDVNFNLYGVGYTEEIYGKNISYKGKYKPDELINHLEGGYGLVWDGISIDTCEGGFGDYLKYNNPHKVSLYLTAGIPVIIWAKSALAKFIEENKLGFTVNSLKEIRKKIDSISEEDYETMCDNIDKISCKLRNGGFLMDALNKIG